MTLPEWLLAISALLTVAVLLGVVAHRLHIPLTVVLMVVGLVGSIAARAAEVGLPLEGEGFEQTVVFGFLPALVFAAVLGASVRSFLRNLPSIVGLAVVALLLATGLVGVGVSLLLDVPLAAALLFGALISATDPVAVVAVFRQVGVPQRLLTLVEGESLFNDATAIVMFQLLLAVALGAAFSPAGAALAFGKVFFGGALVGAVLGLLGALALPWLDRLGATAMSLGVAYGSFILADHIFGFSGVMATVAAGLLLAGMAPSRASEEVRGMWGEVWEAIDYVANALLFLLIGLVMGMQLHVEYLGPMALAVILVLIARALAVIPVVAVLERIGVIRSVGKRNEGVLIWGGLRGGVALALALALPENLAQRDLFVAMTAGVVLATLLINATTISALVRRLGLAEPSRIDQLLAATARLSGIQAAQERLVELGVEDPTVKRRLADLADHAQEQLQGLCMTSEEEREAVMRRGLYVERDTYQHLSDTGLMPPPVARTLLHEVDGQIEAVTMGDLDLRRVRANPRPSAPRLLQRAIAHLPQPPGEDEQTLAYAEATARRLASRRTAEALEVFAELPDVDPDVVEEARLVFCEFEGEAVHRLEDLDEQDQDDHRLREAQADALARVAAQDTLSNLADAGLLPARLAEQVGREVGKALPRRYA